MLPDEKTYVEIPFVEQLKGLGWQHIEGDIDVPYLTERESFRFLRGLDGRGSALIAEGILAPVEAMLEKELLGAFGNIGDEEPFEPRVPHVCLHPYTGKGDVP